MKHFILILITTLSFISLPNISFGQPNLGSTSNFAVFTAAGEFSNDGATIVTGDIGTDVGAFSGFPPGTVIGTIYDIPDAVTAQAAIDVDLAYAELFGTTCDMVLGTTLGNNQLLVPNVYCLGAASTLNGNLTLDAGGDPNAIFIFQIDGAFSTGVASQVVLINGASLCNVYWQINGAVTLGETSIFRGTIIANGAIHILEGATLIGRALSRVGAIDLHNNIITLGLPPVAAMITASGSTSFCIGGIVTLSGNIDGIWSNGEITPSITVTASGIYSVTNSTVCGSILSNTINVTVNPLPVCNITGQAVICQGLSTQICATPGLTSYLWSTGATSACIDVNAAGTYTVTITDINGCTSSCSQAVTANPPPACLITGDDFICQPGQTTELCVPPGATGYLWNTGAITNCIDVNAAGTYTVTITDINGCTSLCSQAVTINPPPACLITGDNFICLPGQTTELCVPGGATSYLWSNGGITNCIDVNAAGTYTVTITYANGCTSSCSQAVTVNPPPACLITGDDFICQPGQTTELCVPPGATGYLWNTGAITNCIDVNAAGTYTVTITYANGCTSSCSQAVTVNPPPACLITGDNFICLPGQTTELCVPPGATGYLWNTGAITNCIDVNAAGTYTVTITYASGCTSSCSQAVTVNPPPACLITGDDFICLPGQTTELCVPPGATGYLWNTGAITNCIDVNAAGTYTVTITYANGCTSSCSQAVTVNPPPACLITGDNFICLPGQTTELCVPPGATGYLWNTGAITNCIDVNAAGTYTVTITYANGCTSSCSQAVTVNPPPACLITGDNFICLPGQTTELCVPPGATGYLWNTGAITNCIDVNAAGTYTVTITYASGCTSSCSQAVTVNPPPACLITGDNFICLPGQTTELCVPPGATGYLWNTGAITNCIDVNAAGTYTVTITYANGCTSSCSQAVTVNPPPACLITGDNFICLPGQTTELCVPPGATGYLWNTGAITNCIDVNAAGTYTVTITYANGCTSSCSQAVTVNPPPACLITGDNFICLPGQTTELCVPPGATNYLWNTGAITNCIDVNAAGTYTVTITYANGCTSSCSQAVTVNPPPACLITGDNFICLPGQTTELCVPPGATGYLWNTGAITNCIDVNAAGTYTVTITYANGCTSSCSQAVTVNPPPACLITGDNFICLPGQTTELCVPPGATGYLWNTGAITNCIDVNAAGTYTVTITYANGCTSSCSQAVTVNPPPACLITGDNFICLPGQTTELCVPPGATGYLWNTGAITNCIDVNAAGTYTVTITYANGCTSSCSQAVTVNPPPACLITGDNFICLPGQTTELCVPPGATGYLWNTGAITNCIDVNAAGTYTVTITYANGCTSSCSQAVTVNPPPACLITGDDFICLPGQTTELCVPPGATGYLWNTGAITNCIDVNAAGTYTVTITYANGCTSSCSQAVTVNPPPACLITGDNFICLPGQTTELCVPPGATGYLWNTGAITNCIDVNAAGTYTVTITYANGCTSSCSQAVTVNPPPACLITGDNFICLPGQTTELCVPPGATGYLWNTGAITNCIDVNAAGTYTVTITYANGCTSSCSQAVTVNPPPACLITGDNFICLPGQTTELCVPPGATGYLWNTGAITNCIDVNAAGTYTVTITYANGCTSSCSQAVTVNPPPACLITGDNFICLPGQTTELCVPPGATNYLWNTGAITNCIDVNAAGTYTVTITYANGCTSSCSQAVTVNPPPACLITGDDFICLPGQTTELCVPPGATGYLWNTGAITNCIDVNAAGTYTVTITYANGCTSSCSQAVTVNPPPACLITGDNFICLPGQTTELCVPPGATGYLWNTGAITNCIDVNAAGTYTVTITYANGCTSSCSQAVTVNPPPACLITGDDFICLPGQTTELCVPPGATNYLWNTGAITNCIDVNAAGTYTVTITYANGCTSSCSQTVTVNPPPACLITGDDFICQPGQTTELCVPPGATNYLWNTGAITNCIEVNAAGTYTVTITYANGCTSSCSQAVTVNPPPACLITGDNFICLPGQTTELCVPPGATGYLWNTGAITNCIDVNAAGTYTVTITYANGCTSSCSQAVTVNPPPACLITGDNFICLPGQTTELCVPPGSTGYLWNTGAITNCIDVNAAGTYTVTITYANGCTSSCSQAVTVNPPPACLITGDDFICLPGQTTELCVPPGATNYLWNTGAITNCIDVNAAGTYTVTITYANGCTSSCSQAVTVNPPPACLITGDNFICLPGQTTELCVPPGATGYLWNTGAITNCIDVNAAGTYTVTITDINGCTSSCSQIVEVNPLTNCSITGNEHLCEEGQYTELCVLSGAASYLWSTGATTNCIIVIAAGTYTVTITNASGCTSICSKTVTNSPIPDCIISCSSSICDGSSTQLCVPAGSGTYLWCTGDTTNCITVSTQGLYSVTITNAGGCSSVCSLIIFVNPVPNCYITCINSLCTGLSSQLCASPGYASYLWNTGDTTCCISVFTTGTYLVTITNTSGCSSVCSYTVSGLLIDTAHENSDCGASNGTASVFAQGGSAPYSYIWSNGGTTAMINNLSPGTYTVTVTDTNGCTAIASILLTSPLKIGDFVWNDLNQNGLQDTGEPGIPDVIVHLTGTDINGNNVSLIQHTDLNGMYMFNNLEPGTYNLEFTNNADEFEFTIQNAGSNDNLDSDPNPQTGMITNIIVTLGECNLNYDAGFQQICQEITDAGFIAGDEILCGPGNDPSEIVSVTLPTGGAGAIFYMWMSANELTVFNSPAWSIIPGAYGPSYDPGIIYQTTYYVRCTFAEGCLTIEESNIVVKIVGDVVDATVLSDNEVCVNMPVTFSAPDNGSGAYYTWNFGPSANPQFAYTQVASTTFEDWGYPVIHVTVELNGCIASNFKQIYVGCSPGLAQGPVANVYDMQKVPLSLQDNPEETFILYPNPVNEYFTIEVLENYDSDMRIQIYNTTGQFITSYRFSKEVKKPEISTIGLPAGIYTIRIMYDDQVSSIKVIKL